MNRKQLAYLTAVTMGMFSQGLESPVIPNPEIDYKSKYNKKNNKKNASRVSISVKAVKEYQARAIILS